MPTQTLQRTKEAPARPARGRKFIRLLSQEMIWKKGRSAHFPFVAEFEGLKCLVRLNDFPAQHLYTLLVVKEEVADFDDWPAQWQRP